MSRSKLKTFFVTLLFFCVMVTGGYLLPAKPVIPVLNATNTDWNHNTFWHPWGKSLVHKGIDIFAGEGTPVISSCPGIVVYTGYLSDGGNVVLVMGPKWRLHYYAHMKTRNVRAAQWVSARQKIGTVGATGNAAGKPAHLHYSIVSLVPHMGRNDFSQHEIARMFYLNPHEELIKL